MENLRNIYQKYKNVVTESVSKNIKAANLSQIEKQSDSFFIDYRKMLLELLNYISKKRHWSNPEISIRDKYTVKVAYKDYTGVLQKARIYGLGLFDSDKFTFRTAANYKREGDDEYDVCEYDPKEIWDCLNWYDIEWKHHFTKEDFLKKYHSISESFGVNSKGASKRDLKNQADDSMVDYRLLLLDKLQKHNDYYDLEAPVEVKYIDESAYGETESGDIIGIGRYGDELVFYFDWGELSEDDVEEFDPKEIYSFLSYAES